MLRFVRLPRLLILLLLPTVFVHALQFGLPGGTQVSFHDGILRIRNDSDDHDDSESIIIPPPDAVIAPEILARIQVRDTGHPTKGFGAFCCNAPIPKHSFLGHYPTDTVIVRDFLNADNLDSPILLDESNNNDNGKNRADYLMSVDGGVTFLNGYRRAQDRSTFSPVHLNHHHKRSDDTNTDGCNCIRKQQHHNQSKNSEQQQEQQQNLMTTIAFFTKRDIQVGEELCFDYGDNYWRGRESEIV